jgi:cell pole-organizing protein PopZ
MSEQTAPEPTMEEILASIRRIISEDDAPAAEAEEAPEAAAAPAPAPEPVAAAPAPEPEPEPVAAEAPEEDDVLELTEKVAEAAPAETHGDIDVYPKEEPAPEPTPAPVVAEAPPPAPVHLEPEDALVGEPAAVAAASSFGKLSAAVAMPAEGRTLEDVTRELLRPLLKAWLDEHLPAIVQAKVDEEVERIARSRVR